MADYESGLPIRSEADGADERVQVKVVDATNPDTQQMEVDTDNNAHVEVHGNQPTTGDDVPLQLSEEGRPNGRGDYDAVDNTKPASSGLIAHERQASKTEAHQTQRVSAVDGSDNTTCLDVAMRDEDGQPYSQTNPLPVSLEESEGDEVCDYNTSSSVAKDASVNHDYTVSAGTLFIGKDAWVSGSGKIKAELLINGAVTFVAFNSTANPNIRIPLERICKANAAEVVRITITNRDNQPQDVYSTLIGVEV